MVNETVPCFGDLRSDLSGRFRIGQIGCCDSDSNARRFQRFRSHSQLHFIPSNNPEIGSLSRKGGGNRQPEAIAPTRDDGFLVLKTMFIITAYGTASSSLCQAVTACPPSTTRSLRTPRTLTAMTSPSPILVAHLFRDVGQRLVTLLRSLDHEGWHLPTLSSERRVRDIASHLLDGSLRRLSMQRDAYLPPDGSSQPGADESLLDFLTRLNADWEAATRRLSPKVLVGLIEWADEQLADLFESLDPFGPAIFPVAWAGEQESQNWMDVARDYTEKWHHTQQIFDATRRTSTIEERRLLHPCLDIFMRALPFTFRGVDAPDGSIVSVTITGEAGGEWLVIRSGQSWIQVTAAATIPITRFTISQDSAWKLFTKRLDRSEALRRFSDIRIEGDFALGCHVIDIVSVMA